jgi:sporulation protein YlmC with PRC-barrel domain
LGDIENLRDWRGKDVLDGSGEKIGTVEDVYFDSETDEPRFLRVTAGRLRHHTVLVPTAGVTASPEHLTVAVSKEIAKGAPTVEPGGELSAEFEEQLFKYYGLEYHVGRTPGGRRLVRR